ncbi:MAG: CinA family nicotinamide mononucleotide deamidase-related protein [Flavobacteriales bacterium]
MKAALLTIGDELLIGQVLDTNSVYFSKLLNEAGCFVQEKRVVGDVESEITEAIECYAKKVDLCFVTGGLGPTNDDITKDTICKIWSDELIWRPEIEQELRRWFLKKGKQPNPMSLAQANVPSKAQYIVNQLGTAPALILKKGHCHFVFMPGVPAEVHGFCNSFFKTWLNDFEIKQNVVHKHLYTTGLSESAIAKRLMDFEAKLPKEISLAYLPDYITVRLRLTALFDSGKEANLPIEQLFQELKTELKDIILFEGEHSLAQELANELVAQNKTVSTAESCTSGALASVLTSISGSSQYFYGAVVAYDNKIKEKLLKVDRNDLDTFGAVSLPVVEQMAKSASRVLETDYALSISGIAGPTGGSERKPVGTTCFGLSDGTNVWSKQVQFFSNRKENIRQACNFAMLMLLQTLKQNK